MPGWRTRGYLPHLELEGVSQFVTFRLHDSLPNELLSSWSEECKHLSGSLAGKEILRRIGIYLDEGHGSCLLKNPVAARIVHECFLFNDGKHYRLHAWVVMPNHVHLLLTPQSGKTLGQICHTLKGYTVHRINEELSRTGAVWQEEYYDRAIECEEGMERVRQYIEWNPVKARLCSDPCHWPWSSASAHARERLGL